MIAVTYSSWKAEFLDAKQSLGFDLPDDDVVWCPGHYASPMYLAETHQFEDTFWWTLDSEYLGRNVTHCMSAEEAADLLNARKFVKLARHKYDYFPAGVRSSEDMRDAKPQHEYIVSDVVDIVDEYRSWVIRGTVEDYSCYHMGDWWWDNEGIDAVLPEEHRILAENAAVDLNHSAVTVDTATLSDGRSIVVETNPTWCSGFYTARPEVVREAVALSQGGVSQLFIPDTQVQAALKNHPLVRSC